MLELLGKNCWVKFGSKNLLCVRKITFCISCFNLCPNSFFVMSTLITLFLRICTNSSYSASGIPVRQRIACNYRFPIHSASQKAIKLGGSTRQILFIFKFTLVPNLGILRSNIFAINRYRQCIHALTVLTGSI